VCRRSSGEYLGGRNDSLGLIIPSIRLIPFIPSTPSAEGTDRVDKRRAAPMDVGGGSPSGGQVRVFGTGGRRGREQPRKQVIGHDHTGQETGQDQR
jgi:hypothetical protein